jgi:Triosephosphate isomerase
LQANRPKGSSSQNPVEGPRRYLIGGNWKCNGLYDENVERINVFNKAGDIPSNVDVVLCVPYIHFPMVLSMLRDDIEVGAQDCGNNTEDGAFTGQVGAHQLKDIGCTWVIIGHSERREGFGMAGEPEALCAEKCKVALDKGLKVMFVSAASCNHTRVSFECRYDDAQTHQAFFCVIRPLARKRKNEKLVLLWKFVPSNWNRWPPFWKKRVSRNQVFTTLGTPKAAAVSYPSFFLDYSLQNGPTSPLHTK